MCRSHQRLMVRRDLWLIPIFIQCSAEAFSGVSVLWGQSRAFAVSDASAFCVVTSRQHGLVYQTGHLPTSVSLHATTHHRDRDVLHTAANESWETDSGHSSDDEGDDDDSYLLSQDVDDDVDSSSDDNEEINDDDTASTDPLMEEHYSWSQAVDKALVSLEKKRASLQSELSKAEKVESTVARAQLLTSYLYMFSSPSIKTVTVQDWENDGQEIELTLNPAYESASAEADALFQQARKLKRGSEIVNKLLEETSNAFCQLQQAQIDLQSVLVGVTEEQENDNIGNSRISNAVVDENKLRLIQDRLLRTSRTTNFQSPPDISNKSKQQPNKGSGKKQRFNSTNSNKSKPDMGSPASNIRKLKSPAGCTILVGRNRRGNEYLSFQVARSRDIWMHARGFPGAHVLILQRRGEGTTATTECMQLAANLAAFYSDSRSEAKAAVSAAEPKHLLKPRGAPLGAVKLRQELQVLTGYPDMVPAELKQAREASGQSDEYRATDKPKLRKRNEQALKEKLAKLRKAKRQKDTGLSE